MSAPVVHATRAAPTEAEGAWRAPRLPGQREPRIVVARPRLLARLRRGAPGVAVSGAFNAAVTLAFAYLWSHMPHDFSQPEAIPVELVSAMPGEAPARPPAPAPPVPPEPESKPETQASQAAKPPPRADPLKDALALPAPPPDQPAAATPAAPPPPAEPAAHAGLAAPPPEPKAAATQPDKVEAANTAPATPDPQPAKVAAPPPPAPEVMTAPGGDTTVAPPAPPHELSPEPPADVAPDPGAEPRMAAALPLSSLGMPATFRAMLSSQGTSSGQEYKGVVYGALSRVRAAVEEEARRRGMKGQVVLLIAVTATGELAQVSVVQSSGSADTDAFALSMVQRAAPFPAPPPGTSRSFTPAITFGDE